MYVIDSSVPVMWYIVNFYILNEVVQRKITKEKTVFTILFRNHSHYRDAFRLKYYFSLIVINWSQ